MSNHERMTDGEEPVQNEQADEAQADGGKTDGVQTDAADGAPANEADGAAEATRSVAIPERIASRVDDRLPRSGFDSRDEYVAFVLEEVLYQVESRTDEPDDSTQEAEVTERLQSLGYLNE